ncbi:TPA: hypothetical protein NR353_001603 [Legionella pneumophila]|uniref:Uncharacterized protein n=1 Tax=Legionella waltersii TaxID=66969 RepID=A0A0W1AGI5_9GAMM|nr:MULTISPECIES: hypothetical protein [Legionella]KTD80434.1 hypothetical protein Lwal_1131 [Legionella waltersii]MBN5936063.1 hypothetical protein [Legionella anisa]SNV10024.1 Uncharacterised protein [Legionella waltersii]HAT1130431.1 hypothetical protein [Legionella pneumophila]HAT1919941.1 hypothetical protein [Legionella pneumophila]
MALDTDVLVVGAGPIGLINAWGMKQLNPNLKIVVLEKYAEYQRSHTLVMQAKQLEAIMKATHSEMDPDMVSLLSQLQKDPHIRTNTLQKIFTKLARNSGVDILIEHEVTKETLKQILADEYPHTKLIIGADGTHSVVNQILFPEENQVKHEFDFVLQLRFEIDGEEKALGIKTQEFYQQMARKGLIANEYVGHFDQGKTPVTMQMMISKEDFLALQKLTSKKPLRLFSDETPEDAPKLPPRLKSFITKYISYKIHDTEKAGQKIDPKSIRISVNEAPATHAKEVVTLHDGAHVVLEGDAALGLSYFKGLNAGLEASARFLSAMAGPIQDAFKYKEQMDAKLKEYQNWFLKDFSPKKIKEVGQYSFWQIRTFMRAMEAVQSIKTTSVAEYDEDYLPEITNYFNHFTRDPLATNNHPDWRAFPHREYDPVKFGELSYVPLKHTAKKIAKILIDYLKPYKSSAHILQDYKQPLVGIGNSLVGLEKIFGGMLSLSPKLIADGLFTVFRGLIELVTFPFAWAIKPITRGIATLIHGGYKRIEENRGMQDLAQYGQEYLGEIEESALKSDSKTIYNLLAICNDMHRKFDKSLSIGESTDLEIEEYASYSDIRVDNTLDRTKLLHYFSLFAPKKEYDESEFLFSANRPRLAGDN